MKQTIVLLAGTRQAGETVKAVQACNDFLRLGPGRTLSGLAIKYREMPECTATKSLNTLQAWSKRYDWAERAGEYDQRLEDAKNARAKEIMESGLALDYERVLELKRLAEFLKEQIFTEAPVVEVVTKDSKNENDEAPVQVMIGKTNPYVWLRDVKRMGTGKDAVTVELIRFNSAILDQFRGVLDDLAKETGGRVAKHEMTGANGGPIEISDEQHNRAISTLAATLGNLLSQTGADGEGGVGAAE